MILFLMGFCQVCSIYPNKFAISLSYRKKEVGNEVRDLTALAGSNTTLTVYYIQFAHTIDSFPLSQYEIHAKPFLHLINSLNKINLFLLFQVKVGPCKLACVEIILYNTLYWARRFIRVERGNDVGYFFLISSLQKYCITIFLRNTV